MYHGLMLLLSFSTKLFVFFFINCTLIVIFPVSLSLGNCFMYFLNLDVGIS